MSAATAVATAETNGLLNFIERAARDPEFDVAKFGELLRMQREIVSEQERREFNRAMSAAQAEMLPIIRDATNTHIGNKYAKLETIDKEMRPIYTSHGFSVRYGSALSSRDGWIRIVCTVSHAGGYSETNYLDAPPDASGQQGRSNKTPVQAVGSSVTYLRRYLLTMVFNIVLANDDDDGEAARRSSLREQINDSVPLGGAPPKSTPRMRVAEWLDELERALLLAGTPAAVDNIIGRDDVAKATGSLTGHAQERLNKMIRDASRRVRTSVAVPPLPDANQIPDWVGLDEDDDEATPAEDQR